MVDVFYTWLGVEDVVYILRLATAAGMHIYSVMRGFNDPRAAVDSGQSVQFAR